MNHFYTGVRHREEELRRAFFSNRFARTLDSLGYARFRHWRLYGEEALAGREVALWLAAESLTLEHAGEPLSRYEVRVEPATGKLRSVGCPRRFGTAAAVAQPRLFGIDALGESGWLKALKLEGYAPSHRAGRTPSKRRCSLTRTTSDRSSRGGTMMSSGGDLLGFARGAHFVARSAH